MSNIIAIVSAATKHAFHGGTGLDGKYTEGVTLKGRLGCVTIWDDGYVTIWDDGTNHPGAACGWEEADLHLTTDVPMVQGWAMKWLRKE